VNGKQFSPDIYFVSVAPFNSILEREKAYRQNENPGPGTYANDKVAVAQDLTEMNSF
jgi:hypothetical protein